MAILSSEIPMDERLVVIASLTFLITLLLMQVFSFLAPSIGLTDHPGGRKLHPRPTPLVGGIGIYLGCAFSGLLISVGLEKYLCFLGCGGILILAGSVDDFLDLPIPVRLCLQTLASAIMSLVLGVVVVDLGELVMPGWALSLGVLAVPFTVFATVGLINAMNMSDGIDGLAGGLAFISLSALLLIAGQAGADQFIPKLLPLMAAILAFLVLNLRPRQAALVFLGDAGSLFLGFALCWLFIRFSQGPAPLMAPITALWLIALPLIDTLSIMARRVRKGRSPFAADREHFHHLLLAAGFSPKTTLGIMLLLAALAARVGLAGHFLHAPDSLMFSSFLLCLWAHHRLTSRAWRIKRFIGRELTHAHQPRPLLQVGFGVQDN